VRVVRRRRVALARQEAGRVVLSALPSVDRVGGGAHHHVARATNDTNTTWRERKNEK
jgi:hypothetical protein